MFCTGSFLFRSVCYTTSLRGMAQDGPVELVLHTMFENLRTCEEEEYVNDEGAGIRTGLT